MLTKNNVFDSFKKDRNIQPTQLISQKQTASDRKSKTRDKQKIYAGAALSLVTLGTLGGILYFVRHGNTKIKQYNLSPTTQTLDEVPHFYNNATVMYSSDGAKNQTLEIKPKWNALVSGYTGSAQELTTKETVKKAKKNSIPQWKRNKDEVVPGIIRKISVEIKDYMKKCGIDKKNNKINPEALDEILTRAVGEGNVKERPYLENGVKGNGRVKEYLSPNGRVYVLEAHNSSKGVVTRLYMHDKDKHLRAYLHADGTFRLNTYTSDEAHFDTTAKGKRWMENSKFKQTEQKS